MTEPMEHDDDVAARARPEPAHRARQLARALRRLRRPQGPRTLPRHGPRPPRARPQTLMLALMFEIAQRVGSSRRREVRQEELCLFQGQAVVGGQQGRQDAVAVAHRGAGAWSVAYLNKVSILSVVVMGTAGRPLIPLDQCGQILGASLHLGRPSFLLALLLAATEVFFPHPFNGAFAAQAKSQDQT